MLNKLDDAKADLLDRAAEAPGALDDVEDAAFLHRYYRRVAPEDLLGRDPVDVAGAAYSHRELATKRPQGTARVRVFTPTVDEHGWASGHTVVEVVTDDMPFLVDSVAAELGQEGRSIHLVVHPQLSVVRTITGDLVEVLDDRLPPDRPKPPSSRGSTSRSTGSPTRRRSPPSRPPSGGCCPTCGSPSRTGPRCARPLPGVAVSLTEHPPPGIPAEEVAEARELLQWLVDDHFTFLGVREYALTEVDGEDVLVAAHGTGLGILRADQRIDVLPKLLRRYVPRHASPSCSC